MTNCSPKNTTADTVVCKHADRSDRVVSIAASCDGEVIATRGLLNRVYIWNANSGQMIRLLNNETPEYLEALFAIAFHPSLPYFAFVETKGSACVLDTKTWGHVSRISDCDNYVTDLSFDPKHATLVGGCFPEHVAVWDLAASTEVARATIDDTPLRVSVSHDSMLVSALSADGQCSIISMQSGRVIERLGHPEGKFREAAFSPSYPLLVSVSSLGLLQSLETAGRRLWLQHPTGLTDISAFALAFSQPLLAVRSDEGSLTVWDYFSGRTVGQFNTPREALAPICFARDGLSILVGGADGCVRRYVLTGNIQ